MKTIRLIALLVALASMLVVPRAKAMDHFSENGWVCCQYTGLMICCAQYWFDYWTQQGGGWPDWEGNQNGDDEEEVLIRS